MAFAYAITLGVALLAAVAVTICLLLLAPARHNAHSPKSPGSIRKLSSEATTCVQVVVLGDIGRSPRMQNHAISLARHGARVYLVGFVDSDIHPDLQKSSLVTVVPLSPAPSVLQTSNILLFTFLAPLKVIWQVFDLAHALGYRSGPASWTLVQNPPSIPTLAVSTLISALRNSKLVIDWHNTGWSILALKLGQKHPLVRVAESYERVVSRQAYRHFTVSNVMSRWLHSELKIEALTLHDRPMAQFKPLTSAQRAVVLNELPDTSPYAADIKSGAWRLIISSTSWTTDEDFSILLDALVGYSACVANDAALPRLRAIITGKGPGKEHYLTQIAQLKQANKLSNVLISTGWFSMDEYIALLGASDLGVSLHKSSSGLDLPMKVVDMFGAGLPVVGFCGYPSWPELVQEGVNGRGFVDAKGLQGLFVSLFSNHGELLDVLKKGAVDEGQHGWDQEWDKVAANNVFFPPVVDGHEML